MACCLAGCAGAAPAEYGCTSLRQGPTHPAFLCDSSVPNKAPVNICDITPPPCGDKQLSRGLLMRMTAFGRHLHPQDMATIAACTICSNSVWITPVAGCR